MGPGEIPGPLRDTKESEPRPDEEERDAHVPDPEQSPRGPRGLGGPGGGRPAARRPRPGPGARPVATPHAPLDTDPERRASQRAAHAIHAASGPTPPRPEARLPLRRHP